MIKITCMSCQVKFNLPDENAGRKGNCPRCGAAIEVPRPSETPSLSDDSGEIPFADEDAQDAKPAIPQVSLQTNRPAADGLVIMPIQDISVVDFQFARILDAPVIEKIGRELYELVDQQARRKIILDFTKVQFMSSQMLGVIINLHKKSVAIKGKVILCGLRPDLQKVFALMKLDKVLRIVEKESQAMEALDFHKGS